MRNSTKTSSSPTKSSRQKLPTCSERFVHIHKKTDTGGIHAVVPLRCKSWDCPKCRRIKSWQIRQKAKMFFQRKQLYFLTLTYSNSKTALETWQKLGQDWNLLSTWLRKRNPGLSYMRFIEPHRKRQYPHLHVLLDRWVFSTKFSQECIRAGFGPVAAVKRCSSDGISNYLTKYLTKEWPENGAAEMRIISHSRIYSASRNLGPTFRVDTDWSLVSKGTGKRITLEMLCGSILRGLINRKQFHPPDIREEKIYFAYDDFPPDSTAQHVSEVIFDCGSTWGRVRIPAIHLQLGMCLSQPSPAEQE